MDELFNSMDNALVLIAKALGPISEAQADD